MVRKSHLVPAVYMLLLAFPGGAAEKKLDCKEAVTDAEIQQCAAEDVERADRALNAAYGKAVKVLASRDDGRDPSEPSWLDALKVAQRAWIKFRDSECEMESYQAWGGTLQPVFHASCLARLSEQRAKEIEAFLKEIDR